MALAETGSALLDAKLYAEAEPLLREAVSLREKRAPDAWEAHVARSLLGGALLGRQKYADAEPLLLSGYAGLKQTSTRVSSRVNARLLRETLERLVQLYDNWGNPDEAAKWRKELEAAAATKPSTKPTDH
jgi:hypothetical protein